MSKIKQSQKSSKPVGRLRKTTEALRKAISSGKLFFGEVRYNKLWKMLNNPKAFPKWRRRKQAAKQRQQANWQPVEIKLEQEVVITDKTPEITAGIGYPIGMVQFCSKVDASRINPRNDQVLVNERIHFVLMPPFHNADSTADEPILDTIVQCASINILAGIVAGIKVVPSTTPLSVEDAVKAIDKLLSELSDQGWIITRLSDSTENLLADLVKQPAHRLPECTVARAKIGNDEIVIYAKATIASDRKSILGVTEIISAENLTRHVELMKAASRPEG